MKTMILKTTAVCFLSVLVTAGCRKYEEGPDVSLLSRKDRVANHWQISAAYENNRDVTSNYNQYELFLAKDGDAELHANYYLFGTHYQSVTNGTWNLIDNDANIRFDYEDNSQAGEYQILRLTKDELWLRKVGADLEMHLRGS